MEMAFQPECNLVADVRVNYADEKKAGKLPTNFDRLVMRRQCLLIFVNSRTEKKRENKPEKTYSSYYYTLMLFFISSRRPTVSPPRKNTPAARHFGNDC